MNDTSQKTDIRALSDLARIEVPEEELRSLEEEIPAILAFVEQIGELSGNGDEEREADPRNVMRDDKEPHEPGAYTDVLLEAAPERADGYVKVKQVIKRS